MTKSVELTPSNPSENGVTTELIKGATNYAPFEWDLYAIDESQFNMKLNLNKSWSFHPQYTTTLTVQIGSDTPTDSTPPTSLIVSFSQNNAKYITSVIEIGLNNDDIAIFPAPYDGKQTCAEGDIEQLVHGEGDRISKAANNGSYGYFAPYTASPNISYPLTFHIENHPDFNYMIFSYFTPLMQARNVIFFGMDTNNTLDIYLSAGHKGDNFDITYFNLTHSIAQTLNYDNGISTTANFKNTEKITTQIVAKSNNIDWFHSALVIILISTVAILCCLFLVFGIMFVKMFRDERKSKIMQISSPKNPMKNEKPLQRNEHIYAPQQYSITSPTLCDILSILTPNSKSIGDVYENKAVDAYGNNIDVNIIYNAVMRNSTNTNTNTRNSAIQYDEEKKSVFNDIDVELECMYNAQNEQDVRRATIDSDLIPGEFTIDDNVNRISIKLELQDLVSGDSEMLYEDVHNKEGSKDTQFTLNGITPYPTPSTNVNAINV